MYLVLTIKTNSLLRPTHYDRERNIFFVNIGIEIDHQQKETLSGIIKQYYDTKTKLKLT